MKYKLLLLLSLGIVACGKVEIALDKGETISPPEEETVFIIEVDKSEKTYLTKSILGGEDVETQVNSITLAAYDRHGVLSCAEHYESVADKVTMNLLPDVSYKIYALANMGDMADEFPFMESDVAEMEYVIPSFSDVDAKGIPMCGELEFDGRPAVTIHLERLFAKLCVRIRHSGLATYNPDAEWVDNFCNRNLYLRQANRKLLPFSSNGSRAAVPGDVMGESDYHSDMNDPYSYKGHLEISQLGPGPGYMQDTSFVFYVPENMQGVLLPHNDDPFRKIYDNIRNIGGKSYSDLCTYVEFNTYNNGSMGYSGDVMYRYYLGADNTSDFNLERNCVYDLTLDFSEKGFFIEDNWKVDTGDNWDDGRELYFLEESYTVSPGKTCNVMVHFKVDGNEAGDSDLLLGRWEYILDEDAMRAAGLTVSFDPYKLVSGEKYNDFCLEITASPNAEVGSSFPMTVMTKEGALVDHSEISVVEDARLEVNWNYRPQYVSQYGTFVVIGYDESELPLRFAVSDGSKLSCIRQGDDIFKVTLKDVGDAAVTVTSADGKKSVTADLTAQLPSLVIGNRNIELNPDGGMESVDYEYRDMMGAPLTMIDEDVFNSVLMPVISGDGFFGSNGSTEAMDIYVKKLNHGGQAIQTGGTYILDIVAKSCSQFNPVKLAAVVTDPFAGVGNSDLGRIDDYTLFSLSDTSTGLRSEFADEIRANSVSTCSVPAPDADPLFIREAIVPRWEGKFSNSNEVYSLSRDGGDGQLSIRQNTVSSSTKHSAGVHDIIQYVKNRHSSEELDHICGSVDIYVHTSIGAKAVFGRQQCRFMNKQNDKTFADVYNAIGRGGFFPSNSTQYIDYMDVSMEWMTPVSGVFLFNKASAYDYLFDGLSFIKPSKPDGKLEGSLLYSVSDEGEGDRYHVAMESELERAGVGRLLYRALYIHTSSMGMPVANREVNFFGVQPGMPYAMYPPAYVVSDPDRLVGGVYDFVPSALSSSVPSNGSGYHIIHFLESIYPETSGWINLID